MLPPNVPGGEASCFFQHLVAPGVLGLWLHHSSLGLHLHITSSSVSVSPPLLTLIRHLSLDLGPTLIQNNLILSP